MKIKQMIKYFSAGELILWFSSIAFITGSFLIFDRENFLTLLASLVGITSLIFCAKGNPIGQVMIIIFSIIYGMISYRLAYYGEMLTYLGMTAPMAVVSLISWVRHPYRGKKSEVEVRFIEAKDIVVMTILSAGVTAVFYFLLKFFNTANLIASTISITTSFAAVYLTFKRSEYYAIAYALNDIVLIALWGMAAFEDTGYISVVVCFVVFLINDIYGFCNWRKMGKYQKEGRS